ncbi:16S rRNA (adenine(1518)-N(6)/adenine(1519)-N(6))-dimethyltransferase RsmA [Methanobrevibacter filiformis]|uniref:Probable ribosomal RNA small subunit methyltransferase A n=1 Tax=Methanobrevibacter filiformis TaxID=55758 RepID=A0A166F9T5_9EURY|nr:16S rRNA (adenine(1518)-N(6)/adenine(1519)-N(6))-dimethyltransferase RsmA [Methanobrevibacter filiformis]KZX17449.1 ribosomal RNA small subunit methyltransferase A [Methanobrevibacter filiformis]
MSPRINSQADIENVSLFQETKSILQDNNIKLKKKYGQNYLIDSFKRKKIINFANLNNEDTVLEIGSGIGTLSLEIAKKAKKLIAIEQDPIIYNILRKRIKDNGIDNIELINEDALNTDFPKFNKIVSNLPYQISSPITFKFLEYNFDLAILMYQKEFAKRMKVNVSTKNYSRLSAMLYFKGNVEFLDDLSPKAFFPPPKITSTVIKLTPKEKHPEMSIINNEYTKIAKALFQHKKKKVINALIDSRHEIGYSDKKELRSILNKYDLAIFNEKVIATSPEDILGLSIAIKDIIK